jgi:hypothetical protein
MRLMAGPVQQGILGDPLGWECGWLEALKGRVVQGKPLRALTESASRVLLLASCFWLCCREWSEKPAEKDEFNP